MPDVRLRGGGVIHIAGDFKAGDPEPTGYLDWHEWARVQHNAGLRQVQCPACCLWRYPFQLSTREYGYDAFTSRGRKVRIADFLCLQCAEKEATNAD